MSDPTKDTLRRTMKAITEIAPEAPSIDAVPTRRPSLFRSGDGWRGPVVAVAASVAVLAVFGLTATGTLWLRSSSTPPVGSPPAAAAEGWVVAAFLSDDVRDPLAILDELTAHSEAVSGTFVNKTEAYAQALERFADDPALITILEDNPDLLPASVRVLTTGHGEAQRIADDAREIRGVVEADLYFGTLEQYGVSPEEILASFDGSTGSSADTADPDFSPAAVHVVVFLTADISEADAEELIAVASEVAGAGMLRNAGMTRRGTALTLARDALASDADALALLDEHPEIVEPVFFVAIQEAGADPQALVDAFVDREGITAILSEFGPMLVSSSPLPEEANALRDWWRAWTYREVGMECCGGESNTTQGPSDIVTTTMAEPFEFIEEGLDLQKELLLDGEVTREEMVRAVAAMARCMEFRELEVVNWSVDAEGNGWSMGYAETNGEEADSAIYNLCYFSYVDSLETAAYGN